MLVYHRVTAGSPQKTSHFGKGRSTSKPPWLERFNYCNFPGCYRYITMAPSQSIRCLESLMKSQAFLFTSFSTSGTTALDDFHHISLFRAKMFTDLKYHYSQLKLLQFLLISKQQSSSSYYFYYHGGSSTPLKIDGWNTLAASITGCPPITASKTSCGAADAPPQSTVGSAKKLGR